MPATTVEPHASNTAANSLGMSFTGHRKALVQRVSGARDEIDVPSNAAFVTGGEAFSWVRVGEPYEGVEITLSPALIAEMAREHGVSAANPLGDLVMASDPVFWAAAIRLRAHALGVNMLSDLEAEAIGRRMLGHIICERFGGRTRRRNARPLDRTRLGRVTGHIDTHLGERLSVSALAATASMSVNHFHLAFRQATGLTPHEFVTARRVERAQALLRSGRTRAQVARTVGYTAGHAFRRALKRFGG
ncbi:helix-turn-helix domain-containing protein [Jannaschia sp. KMU-145]|uniref:helix-turn-helix domain-containing protein n=1 Tax=Jannaschia halovivens TaxID=3388667 RepID=UPI00396B2A4E